MLAKLATLLCQLPQPLPHSPVAVADSDDVDEPELVKLPVAVSVDDIVAAMEGDELPVWLGHTLVLTDAVPVLVLLVVALAVSELQVDSETCGPVATCERRLSYLWSSGRLSTSCIAAASFDSGSCTHLVAVLVAVALDDTLELAVQLAVILGVQLGVALRLPVPVALADELCVADTVLVVEAVPD